MPRADGQDGLDNDTIVASIIQLSRSLRIEAIGEGIETSEQGAALLELGCLYGQGYLYGAPVDAADMTRRLLGA